MQSPVSGFNFQNICRRQEKGGKERRDTKREEILIICRSYNKLVNKSDKIKKNKEKNLKL